jgi:excisionase family DNA binding protein
MNKDPHKLLTYQELSERTDLSVPTLRRYVRKKKIPAVKLGHQIVRFHYPTVLKHLNIEPAE